MTDTHRATATQARRRTLQAAFFALFILAPPLDLLRVDITQPHLILFGSVWPLGIDNLLTGTSSGPRGVFDLILRGLLPLAALVLALGWTAWRYGRLYCGWLCPHFSVVETINGIMRRAFGRPSLWEREELPARHPDGRPLPRDRRYGWLLPVAVIGFAFLWALVLLTYLLDPAVVYGNLLAASLTRNQMLFLGVATAVFATDFLLARHLFCRFGCAVGVFQSLVWMGNRRAMVVGFDRTRAGQCRSCTNHCEHACPMRLKPRLSKRHMFTCTECGRCVAACTDVQAARGERPLLQWVSGACAADAASRDFGHRPRVPADCYGETDPARATTPGEPRPHEDAGPDHGGAEWKRP